MEVSDTRSWKLCKNESAGYELRFPPGWHLYGDGSREMGTYLPVRETNCEGPFVIISAHNLIEAPAFDFILRIHVFTPDRNKNTFYADVRDLNAFLNTFNKVDQRRFKHLIIGGEPALLREGKEEFDQYFVYHQGVLFNIETEDMPRYITTAILQTVTFAPK